MVVNSNTKDIYRQIPSFIERKKSILAVQGDLSQKIVEELFNVKLDNMYFMDNKSVVPNEIELCRCGYTGEDGFEIYLKEEIGDEIREKLVDLSLENENIMFGGLVERDLLRLEAGLCLSGVEFGGDMDIDFKALGMDFMVGLKHRKEKNFNSDFIRSGFVGTRPIKKGEIVDQQGEEVGLITSSNKSFNLNKFIGMGYIRKDRIDNKLEGVERVELPFIEANYKRK